MEIYKDLSSPASQQFEKLLNNQLSKNKIEEGKIIEGKITKITEKFVFIFIPGLKSEPIVDVNELKMIGLKEKILVGLPGLGLITYPELIRKQNIFKSKVGFFETKIPTASIEVRNKEEMSLVNKLLKN